LNKTIIICLVTFGIALSYDNLNKAAEETHAEVGIASIIEDGENMIMNIYSINKTPIAGVQFEIMPNHLFTIDSISGGICDKLGFELHSNNKGMLLAFSLAGKEIPKSTSNIPNDNILFSVYAKKNKAFYNQVITLNTTLASKMGKKINSEVVDYIYK